ASGRGGRGGRRGSYETIPSRLSRSRGCQAVGSALLCGGTPPRRPGGRRRGRRSGEEEGRRRAHDAARLATVATLGVVAHLVLARVGDEAAVECARVVGTDAPGMDQ